MAFQYRDLDGETRRFMVEEIETATSKGTLYFSTRFTGQGRESWPALLLEAARSHDEHWLAFQLEAQGLMTGLEMSRTPSGGYTIRHVSDIAATTMAEGQFNRYYILGVCRRAVAAGSPTVTIYRAKSVDSPRAQSSQIIGQQRDPSEVIAQIRPLESSLRSELLRPNSGLSVHL